jgi:hypothetical protein
VAQLYRGVYNLDPSLYEFKKDFETLCLTNSEVKTLYDVYQKFDNAKNKAVEIDAIFLCLGIQNDFLRKVFIHILQIKHKRTDMTVIESELGLSGPNNDTDDSSAISFDVFLFSVWTLCSLQPSFFELFVFDIYSESPQQEYLANRDMQLILTDIYGPNCGSNFHAIRCVNMYVCAYMSM